MDQHSNRKPVDQHSNRNLMDQRFNRNLMDQRSNRNLMDQRSNRNLMDQRSTRNLMEQRSNRSPLKQWSLFGTPELMKLISNYWWVGWGVNRNKWTPTNKIKLPKQMLNTKYKVNIIGHVHDICHCLNPIPTGGGGDLFVTPFCKILNLGHLIEEGTPETS